MYIKFKKFLILSMMGKNIEGGADTK